MALFWIGSLISAYFNVDGSFKRPLAFAVFSSAIFGPMVGLCLWCLAATYRWRLVLGPDSIRQVGFWMTDTVRYDEITMAEWKPHQLPGKLVLSQAQRKVKIAFHACPRPLRPQLVDLLRTRVPHKVQYGWDEFAATNVHSPFGPAEIEEQRVSMRRQCRFTLIAFGLAIPVMYAILIVTATYEALPGNRPDWTMIALYPIVASALIIGPLCWGVVAAAKQQPDAPLLTDVATSDVHRMQQLKSKPLENTVV